VHDAGSPGGEALEPRGERLTYLVLVATPSIHHPTRPIITQEGQQLHHPLAVLVAGAAARWAPLDAQRGRLALVLFGDWSHSKFNRFLAHLNHALSQRPQRLPAPQHLRELPRSPLSLAVGGAGINTTFIEQSILTLSFT